MTQAAGSAPAAPFNWTTGAVADSGFASDLADRLEAALAAGKLPNLHGVIVARGDRLALERYLAGDDENWGQPLGRVAFGPDTLHDLRSVTKSVVGLLYGIALAQARVPPPDAPLLAQFPAYADLAADPARRRWTVSHVLGMALGTEWDELSIPYSNPANSEIAMERAPDRYRFILDRPIVTEPGTRWIYNGGATALLGHLIATGTGLALPEFAQAALFGPLGIDSFEWVRGLDGATPSAASGLRLRPRDLARIGRLVLQGGRWEGRAVVPAAWLETCLQPRLRVDDARRYGLHWYLAELPRPGGGPPIRLVGAYGNGGQRLFVLPAFDVVVVTTFGNYNRPVQAQAPLALLREVVMPALR